MRVFSVRVILHDDNGRLAEDIAPMMIKMLETNGLEPSCITVDTVISRDQYAAIMTDMGAPDDCLPVDGEETN
jgi:hypothetical protein